MPTHEIPMKEWGDFFESFSRRHEDWLVQLETFNSENAQQLCSQNLRLKSITAEPGGRSPHKPDGAQPSRKAGGRASPTRSASAIARSLKRGRSHLEKENARKKMIVIVGEGETTEISHLIRKPSRVVLTTNDVGADEGLEINSDNALVVIRFRSAILPELVDGVA